MACWRPQRASEVRGLLAQLPALTLLIFVPRRLGATFPIGGFLLAPVLEHFGEGMGGGGRGGGWPPCAAQAARDGAESARTLPPTLRRHASGATGPIVDPSTAGREHCAATPPVVGTEPSPGGNMVVRRPLTHIEADG
jgi:hypothetical protein